MSRLLVQSLPLHHRLSHALRQQITEGNLPPGTQLPTEAELMVRYGVSRTPIRQALDNLVRDGLIVRKRGKGTFVVRPLAPAPLTRLTSFYEDMVTLGLKPSTKPLDIRPLMAPPEVADRLALEAGTPVTLIECLRFANDEPALYTFTYLPEEIGRRLEARQLETTSLYALLEDFLDVPLVEGEYVIGATKAGSRLARALAIPAGSPLLVVERTTFTRDLKPVAFDLRYQRADRIRYALRLKRTPDPLLEEEQPRAGRFEVRGIARQYRIP